MKASIAKINGKTVIVVPEEAIAKLGLKEGHQLRARVLPDGGLLIGPHDPVFDKAMRIAEDVMDRYAETFRALAKS